MGQSNTGVTLCVDTGVTRSYIKTKGKKWETLTLKNRPREKQTANKHAHFKSSVDFSKNKNSRANTGVQDASFDAIPVLTTTVSPAAAAVVANDGIYDSIPVLDKPVVASDKTAKKQNPFLIVTALLLVCALAIMLFAGSAQDDRFAETVNFLPEQSGLYSSHDDLNISKTEAVNDAVDAPAKVTTVNVNQSDILLIQNIVGLLGKEKFSQDTTIDAFLQVWGQLNASTKATLNSTPWFLRFVFSLQKQSRVYLRSAESYDANYHIKINGLLKLAIAVGVMDQRGIQSRAENYSSKQNALVELLKSEIAQIEITTKKRKPNNQSITQLNRSFRARYAVTPENKSTIRPAKSREKTKATSEKLISNTANSTLGPANIHSRQKPESVTANTINSVSPSVVALDNLITRFVTAYEHGDLRMLVSLFSSTAKTNDKSNISGIRQDYKELFEASSFRILNLMNMRWSSDHNSMKGIGDYEIQIAMDEAGNARTLHGKIQFVVGKVNNQLRITRLYHLER